MNVKRFIELAQESHVFHEGEVADIHTVVESLSSDKPLSYWSMEFYDKDENNIKGGGGLGILAADTRRTAQQLGIPLVVVTPFYTKESHQRLDGFWQVDEMRDVSPGPEYRKFCSTHISTATHPTATLDILDRVHGSTRIVAVTEANFGELYPGGNSDDHRLYQEVALGFGGYKALANLQIESSYMQLNESPTVFAAIARLDDLLAGGASFDESLATLRTHILYTNHTLVPAAEGEFSREQFGHFVYPNISSSILTDWLDELFDEKGVVKLSLLAIELAGKKNAVSKLHAEVANFTDRRGDHVEFEAITNGISRKWILPKIERFYRHHGILNEADLPCNDYQARLRSIDMQTVRYLRRSGRDHLATVLASRKDQYGNAISIPDEAVVFDFKRRFASYKRPDLLFQDVDRLAHILEEQNAHIIITGKPHASDEHMKHELESMLLVADSHAVLRQRFHYIQDYDEEVGQALAFGADCALNVPVVGEEACGTSWMKDIANLKLLISTPDGGVADVQPIACFEVSGADEAESLYHNMEQVAQILRNDDAYKRELVRSLGAYLPVLSGPRMMAKYLQLLAS